MSNWIKACAKRDVEFEDLIRFEHDGHLYCIYNTENGFFATDGMCTHEAQPLDDGLVTGMVIECPLHQGRFDIATGRALSAPACDDLKTYIVKLEGDDVYVLIGEA